MRPSAFREALIPYAVVTRGPTSSEAAAICAIARRRTSGSGLTLKAARQPVFFSVAVSEDLCAHESDRFLLVSMWSRWNSQREGGPGEASDGSRMRSILSRKGYHATSGGVASPVFPNDTFCSLPIYDDGPLLREISFRGKASVPLLRTSSPAGVGGCEAHLDPDLVADARPRRAGWRPCFGQVGAAQSHLDRQGVGEGDLFLFFGWFRRVERDGSRWRFLARAPDLHCLLGWLQIGRVRSTAMPRRPGLPTIPTSDTSTSTLEERQQLLYVAADRLSLPGLQLPIAGGGAFARFAACLQLTGPGRVAPWRLRPALYLATARRCRTTDARIVGARTTTASCSAPSLAARSSC